MKIVKAKGGGKGYWDKRLWEDPEGNQKIRDVFIYTIPPKGFKINPDGSISAMTGGEVFLEGYPKLVKEGKAFAGTHASFSAEAKEGKE